MSDLPSPEPTDPPGAARPAGVVLLADPRRRGRGVAMLLAVIVLVFAEVTARLAVGASPAPLRHYDYSAEARVERMRAHGPADVVFAGSSMAWQAFDPATFTAVNPAGRTSFNIGLNGAVPTVAGPWMLGEALPRLHPSQVIWGLSSLDLAPAYGDAQRATYQASAEGRPGPLGWLERAVSPRSVLIRHRADLRRAGAVEDVAEERRTAAREVGPDGARRVRPAGRSQRQAAIQRARLDGFAPDRVDLEAVARTVLRLREDDIEVVLAELPLPPAMVDLHPAGAADLGVTRQALELLAAELDVALIPASPGWADEDFGDFTHLTHDGSIRFTDELVTALFGPDRPADDGPLPEVVDYVERGGVTALSTTLRVALVEQVGCGGGDLPGDAARDAAPGGDVTDPDLAAALEVVVAAAASMSGTCGGEVEWRDGMGRVIDAMTIAVQRLRELTDEPRPGPAPSVDEMSVSHVAAAGVHVYERLVWLLDGARTPRLYRGGLWWSYAQRGSVARLLADAEPEPGVIVVGTSQARTGVDASLLGQRTGARVANLAIDGGTIDISQRWLADVVLPRVVPRELVVVVSGVDFRTAVGPPCPDNNLRGFAPSMELAATAFTTVPWLHGADPLPIVADGGAHLPVALRSPLVEAYEPSEDDDYPIRTQEDIVAAAEPYLIAFGREEYCPERLDVLDTVVEGATAAGARVTVLLHPVAAFVRDVEPEGSAAAITAEVAAITERHGARLVDATALLPDTQMADAVHVTREGSRVLTEALAEALSP